MKPTPPRLPHLTVGLLVTGMALFILGGCLPDPYGCVMVWCGLALFAAGLAVALVGMAWSIWTLTSPGQRRSGGIATPVVAILIAALAWLGTAFTLGKFRQAHHLLRDEAAARAARTQDAE